MTLIFLAKRDIQTGSKDIIVGVIDTGIDASHPDLRDNMWVNKGEIPGNGIDDDGNGYIDDQYGWNFRENKKDGYDDNSHGTHCAGTIGAKGNNTLGVTGVAWNVSLMSLKFLGWHGYGYISDAVEAINYATDMGAHVLSNSWTGGGYSRALFNAISRYDQSGGIFIAAAGNNAKDNDQRPSYPASYDINCIIAVASTTSKDKLSSFSNYGKKSVDIAALVVVSIALFLGKYAFKWNIYGSSHVSERQSLLSQTQS